MIREESMVKISIIVPIFNVEKELKRCIDSILNQSYSNIEVILVNDGSTDDSSLICEKYKDNDPRIKVIHKENGGLSDARNVGLNRSSGDFVLFIDSDDYIESNTCSSLIENIVDDTVDVVVGVIKEIRGDNVSFQKHTNIEVGKKISSKEYLIKSIEANELYAPAVLNLYRREFLINNKLQYKVDRYYEDMEILPRLFMSARFVVYSGIVFYNYIIRENSITTNVSDPKKRMDAVKNYTEWKNYFENVDDVELQNKLFKFLIRCYLKSCRTHGITTWEVNGMNAIFAIKHTSSIKEKVKVMLFSVLPTLYVKL